MILYFSQKIRFVKWLVRSAREGARRPVDAWFAPTEDGTCQRHVAGETEPPTPWSVANEFSTVFRGLAVRVST